MPTKAKVLVPLLFSVPNWANQSAPWQDEGHAGQRFHVIDDRRLSPQAGDGGERRAGPGHAAPALDRGDQGGLLTANERPRALLDLDVEAEAAAEDVLPEQAVLFGLRQRAQSLQGQRILGAAVDVAGRGPQCQAADGHAFQNAVRVAFQQRAVHEGPGVPFIGVADQVFFVGGGLLAKLPFAQVGKPAPPRPRRPAHEAPQ